MPQGSLLKCGDEDLKVVTAIEISTGDICLFKGRIYVVDKAGRTIMYAPDSSVRLMDEPLVNSEHIKFLWESEGELLLAEVYKCKRIHFPSGSDPVRIDLFKLNEKEMKWVKLTSLGDMVLILGMVCPFSVAASDLGVSKGNCVICMHDSFLCPSMGCVLELDDGRLMALLEKAFSRGNVDNTLFSKRKGKDILLVQVYVDDIIFGSTNDTICQEFSKLMQGEFEMSLMGELTFFLGLQIKQTRDVIFLSQTKYALELLKKFDLQDCKSISTPMASALSIDKDETGIEVDGKRYRGMIDSLLLFNRK